MPGYNDVCNMGLMRIGHQDQVQDILTEKTTAAMACNAIYEQSRDTVLRAHNWGFAKVNAPLALLATDAPTNWAYAYAYPADCLMVRSIVMEGSRYPDSASAIPYEIQNVGGVKAIVTDQMNASVIYTCRVEDLNLWDPLAISALAYLIGSEVAMPLAIQSQLATSARQGYAQALMAAAGADANENQQGPLPDCEFIRARGLIPDPWSYPGFPRY